jgi:hypothetical protein
LPLCLMGFALSMVSGAMGLLGGLCCCCTVCPCGCKKVEVNESTALVVR